MPSPGSALPLHVAFGALKVLSDQHCITGTDAWRHTTGSDALADFDPQLAKIVQKQPPSKFGYADTPSLWTATHFYLALPVLSYALNKYGKEDATTRDRTLSKAELEQYCIAFPHIVRLYRDYQALASRFGEPTEVWWSDTLKTAFADAPSGASAATLLQSLPPYLQEKAGQVLNGQGDSLSGRIVLAYLLGQGTKPEALPFDTRASHYVAPMHADAPSRSLYERYIAALNEFAQLGPYLGAYNEQEGLRLGTLLDIIAWYGRPHLVEMVVPGLTGAAEPAIRALSALFAHIVKDGGPDYTAAPVSSLPSVQKFLATQSLESIGRLSIVKDILTQGHQAGIADGATLRQLAKHLYSDSDRQAAWSNSEYYVPDARRASGFVTFRQDIANIVYCAGLFTEAGNNMAGTVDPGALKQLAHKLCAAKSIRNMRTVVQTNAETLNNLSVDWETRYAGHERLRLLRFVRQTFGLEHVKPIPIPLQEINKGFAGSYYDGSKYRLEYREAGERLEMDVAISEATPRATPVQYCTVSGHEPARLTANGLPYSAWLEVTVAKSEQPVIIPVPGRGSFDPFGRVGSPHAGEVVGFGCSVHHASLSVLLAELASLGASPKELKRVTTAFMRINRTMHRRTDLAAFQLAQTVAAFQEGREFTHRDYLQSRQELIPDRTRPHLATYTHARPKSLGWAEPQAARLSFGYPALYPAQGVSTISPRYSWYDGRTVDLPRATVDWRALTCR